MGTKKKISFLPYLYILPVMIIFSLFIIWPAIEGFSQSLFHRGIIVRPDIPTLRAQFVGLKNYAQLMGDPRFYAAFGNTLLFTLIAVPSTVILSLSLALFLQNKFIGIGVIRAFVYWPSMISPIIIGIAWRWIFGYETGILNYLVSLFGFGPIPWLIEGPHAFLSVILVSVWAQAGFFMIIFIGGLNTIPENYYEAASIDGAGRIQRFFHITLPLLRPTTLLVLVLTTINALKVYQQVVVLTEGGPGRATVFLVQNIYEEAFTRPFGVGYTSAQSFIFFLIILLFSIFQFRLMKEDR
jgi:alpha-1,4-digalacturonate transport system permease protein